MKRPERAARERTLFDDDVEELDQDEGRRSGSHRSARSNNEGRDEGKTSKRCQEKEKVVRMEDSDDDDHVVATIHRKSPSKKQKQ